MRYLIPTILSLAAWLTPAQAPHNYTAYDYVDDQIAQCVEDQECGTDTECAEAETLCIRELTR